MIGATLALAMGATLLAVYRFSGSPPGAGVLVFMGSWVVAIACAMQLGASLDRLAIAGAWRLLLKIMAWATVVAATAWAILRAPGPELLTGLLVVPPLVGTIGLAGAERDRKPALAFLVVALALSALLIPAALERIAPL